MVCIILFAFGFGCLRRLVIIMICWFICGVCVVWFCWNDVFWCLLDFVMYFGCFVCLHWLIGWFLFEFCLVVLLFVLLAGLFYCLVLRDGFVRLGVIGLLRFIVFNWCLFVCFCCVLMVLFYIDFCNSIYLLQLSVGYSYY